ncbi:MAG: TetR family transcriptional regulator C-terminal domain-containing protein [Bacteroidia bacterium]|nr:TetR family transcriptional regulator C-terminal domain-containing protein [Bacteroidia bacterium]
MNTDTRHQILHQTFTAIRLHGFQGVRPDKVVQEMGITKGALYHYFTGKKELGYAIVDEIIAPMYLGLWERAATGSGTAVERIAAVLHRLRLSTSDTDIFTGCPLNNLMQEMSPLDEGFRQRLEYIVGGMHRAVAEVLMQGQAEGEIRPDVNTSAAAYQIIAAVEGAFGIAKTLRSAQVFHSTLDEVERYIRGLQS